MSNKNLPSDSSALMLQSCIRQTSRESKVRPKQTRLTQGNQVNHHQHLSPPVKRFSDQKIHEQISTDPSVYGQSMMPAFFRRSQISSENHRGNSQKQNFIGSLIQKADLAERNRFHTEQFYLQASLKTFNQLKSLILANQYQRLLNIVETEIKRIEKQLKSSEEALKTYKTTIHKQTFIRPQLEDDLYFVQIINNLKVCLQGSDKAINNANSLLKKFAGQTNITKAKLTNYFSEYPFHLTPIEACQKLASKFIDILGINSGEQIVQIVSKSVKPKVKGKASLQIQQEVVKSEMSRLIQQYSLSKVKSKKSLI